MDGGKERGCSVADVSKWLSQNPAKLIQLENKKGKIAPGYDADLLVWQPDENFVVTKEMIHHKHKITPYNGLQLSGVVKETCLAGTNVYHQGNFTFNKGQLLLH